MPASFPLPPRPNQLYPIVYIPETTLEKIEMGETGNTVSLPLAHLGGRNGAN